jgi:hypothetical protein
MRYVYRFAKIKSGTTAAMDLELPALNEDEEIVHLVTDGNTLILLIGKAVEE